MAEFSTSLRSGKYPWASMEVGDSFVVDKDLDPTGYRSIRQSIYYTNNKAVKTGLGFKFDYHKETPTTYRVTRVS